MSFLWLNVNQPSKRLMKLEFWSLVRTVLSWGFGEVLDRGLFLHQWLNLCVDSKCEWIIRKRWNYVRWSLVRGTGSLGCALTRYTLPSALSSHSLCFLCKLRWAALLNHMPPPPPRCSASLSGQSMDSNLWKCEAKSILAHLKMSQL